ncbi:S8 family serine peptidase [Algibacter sp. 2305UL17-15]|uniref:S8 family peptidase n=1 Tax=Algibacter sp. 2305UL17-15 TaxID=3231268 RepID=UPI00345819EC
MKEYLKYLLILITLNVISQNEKIQQKLEKINDKYIMKHNGVDYDINTEIITIKLKKGKNISKKYKVIRKNKFGFIDIQVPSNVVITDFANSLSIESEIDEVEYSSVGKYIDFFPNDSEITLQWYLTNINMFQAWDFAIGTPNITVSVLDSGTDWTHTDLGIGNDIYQNIHLNQGEDVWSDPNNPSTGNGLDDDNNGFIDDWKGWNYANNSNDTRTMNPHGTQVAGIVGAKTNNNRGISGLAGGNNQEGIKILPYCIGVIAPVGALIDDAIIDAVDNGANVIQMSLHVGPSNAIDTAIQYATDNDVVVVCASGNSTPAIAVQYPASNNNIISVGATDQNDTRANFSNFGNNLDIVAPGVGIHTTTLSDNYIAVDGTSFAAPQVSGVAALILSINPNLTAQEVRNIIESTAQKVGGYAYATTSGRNNGTWDDEMGYGLLNAHQAVLAAQATLAPTITIDGPSTICHDGLEAFTLSGVPSGATVVWEHSSNLDKNIPLTNNTQIVVESNLSGPYENDPFQDRSAFVRAIVNGQPVQFDFWIGTPNPEVLSGDPDPNKVYKISDDCIVYFEDAAQQLNLNTSNFQFAPHNIDDFSGSTIYGNVVPMWCITQAPYLNLIFEARMKNECGWGEWKPFTYFLQGYDPNYPGGYGFSMFSPSPEADLTVEIQEGELVKNRSIALEDFGVDAKTTKDTYSIIIVDVYGFIKYQKNGIKDKKFNIKKAQWAQGIYYIRVTNSKGDVQTKGLAIN